MKRCLFAAAIVAACLVWSTTGPDDRVKADEPDPKIAEFEKMLDRTGDYRCNQFLKAAEMAQALGKDVASKVLLRHSRNQDVGFETSILCRMLFVAKADGFRPPGLGAPKFLGGTKSTDWPLGPIELVDGVPFDITIGYVIAGLSEPASSYVEYCLKNCDWSKVTFRPKSGKELNTALDKLLKSPKWQRPLEQFEIDLLKMQTLENGS